MNVAELYTVITFIGCVAAAGTVAASEKAGWFTLIFVFAGLAMGFGFGFVVRKLAYWLLDVGGRQTNAFSGWGMMFAYMFLPPAVAFAAIATIGWVASFVLRHVL